MLLMWYLSSFLSSVIVEGQKEQTGQIVTTLAFLRKRRDLWAVWHHGSCQNARGNVTVIKSLKEHGRDFLRFNWQESDSFRKKPWSEFSNDKARDMGRKCGSSAIATKFNNKHQKLPFFLCIAFTHEKNNCTVHRGRGSFKQGASVTLYCTRSALRQQSFHPKHKKIINQEQGWLLNLNHRERINRDPQRKIKEKRRIVEFPCSLTCLEIVFAFKWQRLMPLSFLPMKS